MRVAIVENGIVSNVVVYPDGASPPDGSIALDPGSPVAIGWLVVGGIPQPPDEPAEPRSFTPLELVGPGGLLTDAEKAAISVARLNDIEVDVWAMAMLAAERIHADDPRTVAGFAFAVSKGLLTQARADAILGA